MSERVELLARLQSAAVEVLGDEAPDLTEETEFRDDTVDSLSLVEMLMLVEEEEGFLIDAARVSALTTVGDLIDTILELRAVEVN
jgi:acyl carrier protein